MSNEREIAVDADGNIETVVTYLEMTEQPSRPGPPVPAGKIALLRAEKPGVAFYRFLYNTIGEPWLWWERRELTDADLAAVIHDDAVEIYILYVGGVPAGYVELDTRKTGEVELAYFGLMPDFIGRGLGPYLLSWSVDQAWSRDPKPSRVWLHTCTLDHPSALKTYQRAGFNVYDQETEVVADPRAAVGSAGN